MKIALKEWLMLGIGVLVISVFIFGTMYNAIQTKTTEMNQRIVSTNLPGN